MIKNKRTTNLIILSVAPVLLIITAFILDTPREIFTGLAQIIFYPDILLIDYIVVGGIGATFLNVGLVTLVSILIVHFYDMDIDGPLIAAILTIVGFSFIGKNIINTWPIFLGTVLYVKNKATSTHKMTADILFATTLAPAVSQVAFGLGINYFISIPVAIVLGMTIGFVIIPLANSMRCFHGGYNLYNVGFAGGIIGTVITSLLKGFGFNVESQFSISTDYSAFLGGLLTAIFVMFVVIGWFMNNKSFKGYMSVMKESGKGNRRFVEHHGFGLAYINIGVLGLVSVLYVILVGGVFNGPIVAGILTVAAFAPYGKHPKNTIPILLGVFLAAKLMVFNAADTSIIMAALFGTTLAPIAGSYGMIAGIAAGFLHLSVVSNIGVIHGGLNLYNNGFSGGIVAAILVPIVHIVLEMKRGNTLKQEE